MKRLLLIVVPILLLGGAGLSRLLTKPSRPPREVARIELADLRRQLFAAVQPVKLSNCTLQRVGEPNDGGYLVCGNLLEGVDAAYSYGVNGYDGWGCAISRAQHLRVHQYDCFEVSAPLCPGGDAVFHAECVGASPAVVEGRPFETLANQMTRNGDSAKRLVMKMDVEGAEWDTLQSAPDAVLDRIDQLIIEFHGTQQVQFLEVIERLKQRFYVAHLHFNNYACDANLDPFPSWAYEVLMVNKRIGVLDPAGTVTLPDPLDAPNLATDPDCQRRP